METMRGQGLVSVLSIVRAMAGIRGRDELMRMIAEETRRLFPADFVVVAVIRGDRVEAFCDPPLTLPSTLRRDFRYGEDPTVLDTIHVFGIEDVVDYPLHHQMFLDAGLRATCRMPLVVEDRVVGALITLSRDRDAYANIDLGLATAISSTVAVALDNCLAYEQVQLLRELAEEDNLVLREQLAAELAYDGMIGAGGAFTVVRGQLEVVAPTDATVLITGESGTGKDVVARAIHAGSGRASRAMVTLNCAALPSALAESELFGHVEGAFTGAVAARVGRFEAAHESTLFLDEVGELSLDIQAKLLRVLQQRELERVGSGETIALDVRVIAATNRDLQAAVADGTFRADLFYRLSVFPIHVPPLRDRRDDLPALIDYFIDRAATRLRVPRRKVSRDAMVKLTAYDWPGNVRELQNAIERAMILSHGDELDVSSAVPGTSRMPTPVREEDSGEYTAALEASNWVIEGPTGAAARLGMHPNTLRHRLKRLGITRPR